jgi:hypothetical protein
MDGVEASFPSKPLAGGPQSRQESYGIARPSGTVRTVMRCRLGAGVHAMPSVEYFRRQADICRQLAEISSSKEAAPRLLVMARDYQTKVDAIEAESAMPAILAASASPDREQTRLKSGAVVLSVWQGSSIGRARV